MGEKDSNIDLKVEPKFCPDDFSLCDIVNCNYEALEDKSENKLGNWSKVKSFFKENYGYLKDAYWSKENKTKRKVYREKVRKEILEKELGYYPFTAKILSRLTAYPVKGASKKIIAYGEAAIAGGIRKTHYHTVSTLSGIDFDEAVKANITLSYPLSIASSFQFAAAYTAIVMTFDSGFKLFGMEIPPEVYNVGFTEALIGFIGVKNLINVSRHYIYKKFNKYTFDPGMLFIPSTMYLAGISLVTDLFGKGIDVTQNTWNMTKNWVKNGNGNTKSSS